MSTAFEGVVDISEELTLNALNHDTGPLPETIHLVLFVAALIAVAVIGLAVLERVGGGERRMWTPRRMAIPLAVLAAAFVAERIYHLVR